MVVAVSGGSDSLALFSTLCNLRSKFGYHVLLAHMDHGLRPASKKDANFVREIAHVSGIQAIIERHLVQGPSPGDSSSEQRARKTRYDFLRRVANQTNAKLVALGHTADDQAETILLHILRGSGLSGLVGMQKVGLWPFGQTRSPLILRPLLGATRRETVRYCASVGFTPLHDSTNDDLSLSRNRVRHLLLPLLEEYNPKVRQALLRLGQAANRDLSFLQTEAASRFESIAELTQKGLSLSRPDLKSLPLSLQVHVLRLAYAEVAGNMEGLSSTHLDALLDLVQAPTGKKRYISSGIRVSTANSSLLFSKDRKSHQMGPSAMSLPIPGTVHFGKWVISSKLSGERNQSSGSPYQVEMDAEAVGAILEIRGRRPGDRFQPLGMFHEKKLQDFLVDEKVPKDDRNHLPLVTGKGQILWVVGKRISEKARLTPNTRKVLALEATPSSYLDDLAT